jgi:RNA polymerase sigma factor (sigma-70 family)
MLSDNEIEALLGSYRGLFYSFAKKYSSFPADDLVQEAMVAVWKELQRYDGALPLDMVIKKRAKWRMAAIACGQAGWISEHRRSRQATSDGSYVTLEPRDPSLLSVEDTTATQRMDDAEFTAYRHDIVSAMQNSLTPKQRKYLAMKKMADYSVRELAAEFGYAPYNIFSPASQVRLRKELSHLESMVN